MSRAPYRYFSLKIQLFLNKMREIWLRQEILTERTFCSHSVKVRYLRELLLIL